MHATQATTREAYEAAAHAACGEALAEAQADYEWASRALEAHEAPLLERAYGLYWGDRGAAYRTMPCEWHERHHRLSRAYINACEAYCRARLAAHI